MINGMKIVSLCISRLHDMENFRFINELNRRFIDQNTCLFIYDITADLYWNEDSLRAETAVFDLIDFNKTDLLIIMDEKIKSKTISSRLISRAHASNVPVIVVDGDYKDDNCLNVVFDYGKGFEAMMRHIVYDHGITDLHLIAGLKNNPFSDEREQIFKDVLAEKGIEVTQDMISYGDFWAKPAIAACEKLITYGRVPRAIICANDIMALNVITVLTEHGFKIPDDVIVTGFDGIDEIYYSVPKLSSVRCSGTEIADIVFSAIDDYFRTGKCSGYLHVVPRLLRSESCGCEAAHMPPDYIQSFNDRFYQYQDDARELSDMSDHMYTAKNITRASAYLADYVTHDFCCIINERCLDETNDPFVCGNSGFDDEMVIFFDSKNPGLIRSRIRRSDIIPDVEKMIQKGLPLIFNVIDFMDVPLGYICFRFPSCELTDYCMIPQLSSSVGRGLGGYMSMRYQNYLREKLEEVYKYDGLTGIYNRVSFARACEKTINSFADETVALTVYLADLDGLKGINDRYGHAAGDAAIKAVANALKYACPPEALCVRFGGDEMLAVVFGECDSKSITSKIDSYLDDFNRLSGNAYKVSASVGVYQTDTSADINFETLVKKTDAIMYQIKQAKKSAKVI